MKTTERTYSFPSSIQLERFMKVFDHWSGYEINNFYSVASKSGDMKVTQALPFMQAKVAWKIAGNSVTFDFCYPMLHFDTVRMNRILDFMTEQANLFGAGISRYR